MRAVVQDRYGPPDVLRIVDVAQPVPKDGEVLVRVHATTVNRTDCACRAGTPLVARLYTGLRRPRWRISGSELAGEVEAVGAAVGELAVGDRVFGCNAGAFGAHAELVCVPESGPLAKLPEGIGFEEAAAACDGAILALNALRPAAIGPGQRLLVYGASGAIGTAGVQLGKHHFGAHVTAVCNTKNLELVRSLGADRVIDYTQEDFTADGETYDVVFDAVGKLSFRHCRGALAASGAYVPTDGWLNFALGPLTRRSRGRRVVFTIPPRYRKADVLLLLRLLEQGAYRPVVDRAYPLEQVVEASRYVETEQKTGNVVLTVIDGGAGR